MRPSGSQMGDASDAGFVVSARGSPPLRPTTKRSWFRFRPMSARRLAAKTSRAESGDQEKACRSNGASTMRRTSPVASSQTWSWDSRPSR